MDRDALTADLLRDEGLRLKPYQDTVGKLTIGVGRNLSDVGISRDEALILLSHDIDTVEADLDRVLTWWRAQTEPRQRVLANLCFNLGIGGLMGFHHALAAWQAGDYATAARELLQSQWAVQVGDRATRLAAMVAGT
jgi:lysozyme